MAKTKVSTDVRDLINDELKQQERTLTWLHKKTEIAYSTLYNILKHKISTLDQTQLDAINSILGTDFKLS
ncbi:MAG: hypothetical protein KBA90_13250 [Chitinophagaceae bacterium]|nr:hypothetical protein [Chitinophagaceae bacterium]MBP7109517.1 hypothetical protein [Chitinophagaceae bacterium]